MEEEISIFSHYNSNFEDNERILEVYEKELEQIIEKECNDFPDLKIAAIKRKGLNLFYPYLNKTTTPPSSIKLFDHSELIQVFVYDSNFRDGFLLLTDAINRGEEIGKIINGLF